MQNQFEVGDYVTAVESSFLFKYRFTAMSGIWVGQITHITTEQLEDYSGQYVTMCLVRWVGNGAESHTFWSYSSELVALDEHDVILLAMSGCLLSSV
jgi:hypothetical protein